MGLQSIIEKSDFTNFLQCGAILQLEPNQYKLIWGPFHDLTFDIDDLEDEITVIYKPHFWNFISNTQQAKMGSKGVKEKDLNRVQLLECLKLQDKLSPAFTWESPQDSEFKKQFEWSQQQFLVTDLIKAVPIIFQNGRGPYTTSHLVNTLIVLLEAHHFGSTYGYWNNGEGFLGQTPERILSWDPKSESAYTMALAGTMSDQIDVENLIQNDTKIVREHEIVVQDLKLALIKQDYEVLIQPRQTLKLKYLVHLLTPILINNVGLKDTLKLTEAVHPSAALGLFPRSKRVFEDWIKFEIQKERKNFAAPFGFFRKNKVHVVAAIRSFFFTKSGIRIYSGCGITTESQFDSELLELQTKRNSVKKMMGLE